MRRKSDNFFFGLWLNLLTLVLFLIGLWTIGLFRFVGEFPKRVENTTSTSSAIVVLTGGSGRVEEGLALLERKLSERLFVSGVYQGVDVRKLLQIARRKPEELEARVRIGNATDTVGNATETAAWSSRHRILSLRLVTAAYHMPRSMLEFRHAMPNLNIIPNPVFPNHVKQDEWWVWPGTAALFIREYNKFLMAWARIMGHQLLYNNNLQITGTVPS